MTDGELLAKYASESCEVSFRRLVERYLSLVQGVALRRTGRPELTDDIAMEVFAQAARKGHTLSKRASLAGWFVLAARLTAAQTERKDRNRMRLMQKAATHSSAMHAESSSLSEAGALSFLDDALARLSERERDAIVLHFYNGLTFREMGEREGMSEDALRKRVGAALEKMSRFFRRRGVVLSIPAVAAALSPERAAAETVGMVTEKALALSTSLPASQLFGYSLSAMNLTKSLTALAAIGICLVPLGWQHAEIAAARDRVEFLKSRSAPVPPRPSAAEQAKSPPVPVPAPEPPIVAQQSQEIDLRSLAEDALQAREGNGAARGRLRAKLDPLDAAKLLALLESAGGTGLPQAPAKAVIEFLLAHLESKDPEQTAKLSARHRCAASLRNGLEHWAKADPAKALAWFSEQTAAGVFKAKAATSGYPNVEHEGCRGLATGLFASDRKLAKEYAASLSPREQVIALGAMASAPGRTAEECAEIAAMATNVPPSKLASIFSDVVYQTGHENPDQSAALIRSLGLDEKEQTSLLVNAALAGADDPAGLESRLAWLAKELGPEAAPGAQGQLLGRCLANIQWEPTGSGQKNIFALAERLAAQSGSSEVTAQFLEHAGGIQKHPEEWFRMAASLPPGKAREQQLKWLMERWTQSDQAAAAAAAASLKDAPPPRRKN